MVNENDYQLPISGNLFPKNGMSKIGKKMCLTFLKKFERRWRPEHSQGNLLLYHIFFTLSILFN